MLGRKLIKYILVCIALCLVSQNKVLAQDITAIDFSGNVIGKVIPDGTAINLNNQIMGQLTADSFILDANGNIVGGIVPQGVAIGNDHKYLGKVSNDGTVRLPSGRIIGKSLPNALVVDDNFQIIGSVLQSGVIYNDSGAAVGRLTGDGIYVNFDGQSVGFVSASGYAYKKTQSDYVLEGKLLSSKTVVSKEGKFIGSVAPGGNVTDFNGKSIGRIHANGYVFDANDQIVGAAVKSAYAFDIYGHYLGLVSYNGEVLQQGKPIGYMRADHNIVDLKNNVIGFSVPLNAVALDMKGALIGYLAPSGKFIKGNLEPTGFVGPRKTVVDAQGTIIGYVSDVGPVFDYLGRLKAEATVSGKVVSFEGSTLGYMKNNLAFDNTGLLMGGILDSAFLINAQQNILGLTGVSSEFILNGVKHRLSPLGYLLSSDYLPEGSYLTLTPTYKENGTIFSYLDLNGYIDLPEKSLFRVDSNGYVLDEKGVVRASQIVPEYITFLDKNYKGTLSQTNVVYDAQNKQIAKILPEYTLVSSENPDALMPVVGEAAKQGTLVMSVKGDLVGYVNQAGDVFYQNTKAGFMNQKTLAYNDKNVFIGQKMPFAPVVNKSCEPIGFVGPKGEVRNGRDNVLGKLLINGEVVSETGQNIGHIAYQGAVYDNDGNIIGTSNQFGQVLNVSKQNEGCLDATGRLYSDTSYKGAVATPTSVISFNDAIIGRVNLENKMVNAKSEVFGHVLWDGAVSDGQKAPIGIKFLYRFAFDRDNNFLGIVDENANVYDGSNNFVGKVSYDGIVTAGNKAIGYALYDLYIYNDNNIAIGYLTRNGKVMDFSGNTLGRADRGFLLSKDGVLIGRPNRDYFVRNKKNEAVGELLLSGDVVDLNGTVVGTLLNNGEVRNKNAQLIGQARPLQYYVVTSKRVDFTKTDESDIKVEPVNVPQDEEDEDSKQIGSYAQKVIGVVVSPDGKYLGDLLDGGIIINPNTGDTIGYSKDGLAFDNDNNLIGTVEGEKVPMGSGQVSSQIYLPQDAYGISDKPSNLGPGGGFGPNERYDPVRARLLAEAQNLRQGSIKVGKISSNINPSSFTGMQSNWDNANYTISSWRVDMSEMILADKPIPAVLARTIMDSGTAGNIPVTAIVERNVYAEDGRNIVIPAGSRVMGESSGGGTSGSSGSAVRVDITWTRLIRPDGSAFDFVSAQTGDAQGRGGALGYLDEQLLKRYTLPMATSFMSSALAYITASGQTTTSSDGSTVQDSRASAAEEARTNFLNNMDEIFQDILQRKTNIEAVTYVPAGTRLIIYPKVDMWLRTAAREQEESFSSQANQKPTVLIDDEHPDGRTSSAGASQVGHSTGSNGQVVYDGNNNNVAPASSSVLIDDSQYEPKRKARPVYGATPPPPSTTSASSSSDKSSDTSAAQLF